MFKMPSSVYEQIGDTMRNISLEDKMFEERIIFVYGTVTDEMSKDILQQLLYLDKKNHDPITMYIDSPGGYCQQGLTILNTMEMIDSPIIGVVVGEACSMAGTMICRCDERYALKDARIMLHQAAGGAYGRIMDARVQFEQFEQINDNLVEKIAEATGHSKEEMLQVMDRDKWFTAEEAKDFGIIDHVLQPSKSPKKRQFKK